MTTIRNAFDRERLQFKTTGKTRTKQSFAAECDINNIMSKFQKTGAIQHLSRYAPQYGEISSRDFKESMDIVTAANSMFADLPSSLRERFANDPSKFLEFVGDRRNVDEMIELGLAERTHTLPPESAPIATPRAAAPDSAPDTVPETQKQPAEKPAE